MICIRVSGISLIGFTTDAGFAYLPLNYIFFIDDCFIKLFRISQLTIEQLLDSQKALCGHLNHLAKKYAEKKREIQSLTTNLSRQDVEVATLRDELHYLREERRLQQVSPKDVLDPTLYPSQKKRDEAETPPDEIVESNDGDISESPNQTDSETKDECIQLNIVVSSLGKCLTLNTHPSTTVEDLVEQLIMELLAYTTEGATWELKFKDQILNDYLQTIQDAGIDAENNGLVLEMTTVDDGDDSYSMFFDEQDSSATKKGFIRSLFDTPNTEEKRRAQEREREDVEMRELLGLNSPETPRSNDTLYISSSSSSEENTSLKGEGIPQKIDDVKKDLFPPSSSPFLSSQQRVSSALTSAQAPTKPGASNSRSFISVSHSMFLCFFRFASKTYYYSSSMLHSNPPFSIDGPRSTPHILYSRHDTN